MPEISPLFRRDNKPKIDVITATTSSATIAALLVTAGTTIQDWCKVLTLKPHATGAWLNDGTAVTNADWPMLTNTLELIGGQDTLDTLQIIADTGTIKIAVMQEG